MTAVASPSLLRETARDIFDRNCRALGEAIPFPELAYCRARDGSLTAKIDGRWLASCSVPRRAAERMVKSVAARGQIVCLLLPSNPHQIAALLDHLTPGQSIIALLSTLADLPSFLALADLSEAIAAHRLFFTDADSLRGLYDRWPGLAPAQQLVRLADVPADRIDAAMATAQAAFSEIGAAQVQRAGVVRQGWNVAREGIFVHGPQRFELWNDAGRTLADLFGNDATDTSDAATCALPLIAERAAQRHAMLVPNIGRSDRPEVAHPQQPWITWVTRARVPAFVPSSPRDGLLLADESLLNAARQAGWPTERVAVAAWPVESIPCQGHAPLAIIADLPDLTPPADIANYSSWRIVWEAVLEELTNHPLALGDQPARYLDRALVRLQLPSEGFPFSLFLERLLPGAFLVGVARLLRSESIPLAIFGAGWESQSSLAGAWRGPITTREAWRAAVASSSGLIDGFLADRFHPCRSLAIPRLAPLGMTRSRLIQEARGLVVGRTAPAAVPSPTLTRQAVEALLRA